MGTVHPTPDWLTDYQRGCASSTVIALLASRWTVYVVGALRRFDRPLRFNELRRLLDGITQKMLTQTLRGLERDGLVERTVYPTTPPRVEYALTPLGAEVAQLLVAIGEWSSAHVDEIQAARRAFDERAGAPPAPLRGS